MGSLRSLVPYLRPYRGPIAVGLVFVALAQGFQTLGPWILKLAIDAMSGPDAAPGRAVEYALIVVGVALLGGAARFGMRQVLNSVSRRVEVDLRNDLFDHLLTLDESWRITTRTGDLMARAGNDTLAVRQAAGPAIMYTVNTTVGFVTALAFMVWISPRLTGIALVPMLLLPPVVIGFGNVIHRRFEAIQEHYSTLSTMVQENLTGMRIVRAYSREGGQIGEFDGLNREYRRRNMDLATKSGLFHPLLGLLAGVSLVVVLYLGGQEAIAGRISAGDYVAFFFYLSMLMWPLIALGWVTNLFQRGAASMARIDGIFAARPTITPPAAAPAPVRDVAGRIEMDGVSFHYPGAERPVLRDVSFVAEPGQTVALVGSTGSGKSTLVSLIPRLFDPDEGEVRLDGVPLQRYDPVELRSLMGVVPQDVFLFSDTLEANIALGADPEQAHEAARVAQLEETILSFEHGWQTRLGERGVNLSGGQKQRAALARALARQPRILILDDALSAVDTSTEARILQGLREVMRSRTAFVISHRVSAVRHADLILVLDDGRIVERGTHDELVARGGHYAAMVRRQALESEIDGVAAPTSAPESTPA